MEEADCEVRRVMGIPSNFMKGASGYAVTRSTCGGGPVDNDIRPSGAGLAGDRLTKPHGSKVKKGAYKDCLIELDESKEYAFIVVDPARGNILYLTSDTIQSCEYVKKAKKRRYLEYKTYYYYDITFKDGNRSYVRMRKKYRNAMFNHMTDHM